MPFFAYIPLPSPHTPIVPTPQWQGKSKINDYGDFMMQTDAFVGAIMDSLHEAGLTDNTILIVTSDNGCSPAANFNELESKGHFAHAQFRGAKADLWEGGHRVPFIVRWPDVIPPGSSSDEIICQSDLFASFAELIDVEIPANAAEDSVSFVPAFRGEAIETTRKGIIHHSISGHFAYREGKWKLLLAKGSAGWAKPREKDVPEGSPRGQLYDLEADPGETTNLFEKEPEVVERLLAQLTEYVEAGRSNEGPAASNDIANIKLWK